MPASGDLRVSRRGQLSLPASARHRWALDEGGTVAYLDLGDAVLLIPGGVDAVRADLLASIDESVWAEAGEGFGDADLATQ